MGEDEPCVASGPVAGDNKYALEKGEMLDMLSIVCFRVLLTLRSQTYTRRNCDSREAEEWLKRPRKNWLKFWNEVSVLCGFYPMVRRVHHCYNFSGLQTWSWSVTPASIARVTRKLAWILKKIAVHKILCEIVFRSG